MNIEAFEFKKPGCDTVYKLKLVNSVFYVWKNKKWVLKKFSIDSKGYFISGFSFEKYKQTFIKLHRLIYYAYHQDWNIFDDSKENTIDHINIEKTNNDISNLRILNKQQQQFNTKCKGYCWHKQTNKWRSQIKLNGIAKHLGLFNTEQEARFAYERAKAVLHKINEDDD